MIGEPVEEDEKMRNKLIKEEEVPEGRRFPQMFYGDGVRGHFYHVFNEPRYYA